MILLWFLRDPICELAGQMLVEDDGAAKADAIVVLGGDQYGTRILRGAELKRDGYASRVFVSAPINLLGHDTDQLFVFAERKGYPPQTFEAVPLTESAGASTRTEADFMGNILRSEGIKSIDLVTSNFHTRRAAWLWRRENPDLRINVVPAPDPYFTPATWFKTRAGQKTFLLEFSKTIAAHLGD